MQNILSVSLTSAFRVKIQKIETIDNFYVKKLLFDVLMCWIHKFQTKIFILNLLSNALVNIYHILKLWMIKGCLPHGLSRLVIVKLVIWITQILSIWVGLKVSIFFLQESEYLLYQIWRNLICDKRVGLGYRVRENNIFKNPQEIVI